MNSFTYVMGLGFFGTLHYVSRNSVSDFFVIRRKEVLNIMLYARRLFICLHCRKNFLCRFSPDPETSMGLVQHEGGPCGVLATIQVSFILIQMLCFLEV